MQDGYTLQFLHLQTKFASPRLPEMEALSCGKVSEASSDLFQVPAVK